MHAPAIEGALKLPPGSEIPNYMCHGRGGTKGVDVKKQAWIFSIRYYLRQEAYSSLPPIERWAVVGPACASTVEAALRLSKAPEDVRVEIRSHAIIRMFIDGQANPALTGYYVHNAPHSWLVCIGPVHEVLGDLP